MSAKHISTIIAEQCVLDRIASVWCCDCDGRLMPRERVLSVVVMVDKRFCASLMVDELASGWMYISVPLAWELKALKCRSMTMSWLPDCWLMAVMTWVSGMESLSVRWCVCCCAR